uniref:Phenoloxidase-activating factor 2 n=1 Tax=Culicoides sonorensis TaxID=179676 RepID=A0A336LHB9_CULSO
MLNQKFVIVYFVICMLHISSSQDIQPTEIDELLKDVDISNSSEARAYISEKLCSIGYCGSTVTDELLEKTKLNRIQRQFQTGNLQDYSGNLESNIDYSEYIGEGKQQYIQPDINVPSPASTHIHHHFHHNGNEDYGNDQIDLQGIRNAKNYAFQQQKFPVGVKKFATPNNYFERPPLIVNPNYSTGINKAPIPNYNTKKTQYFSDKNYQHLQTLSDCSCVPFQYCATEDVVGRRDDLVLPLDPRNLNKDIEAEQNQTTSNIEETTKHISKRDVDESNIPDVEPRFGGSSGVNHQTKKTSPSIGISFGLPIPSPNINPYLNYNGLNLGLVNVNPFFSLHLNKDESGDKVLHPSINLHITPNEQIFTKLIDKKFHAKKLILQKKLNNFQTGHIQPEFYPHPPIPHHHNKPDDLYLSPVPYESPNFPFIPPGHEVPFPPIEPIFYGPSNTGFNPLYDSPPTFPINSHYRSNNNTISARTGKALENKMIIFPNNRRKRTVDNLDSHLPLSRLTRQNFGQANQQCPKNTVCCKRPYKPQPFPSRISSQPGSCGIKSNQGINGRIKTPSYTNGNTEFGEYPWQAAILKKDARESVYVCGGTLISPFAILTAAHCVQPNNAYDLRVRLGEWDVNHDVEFYPFVERDVSSITIHPQYYAGTLENDIAILKLDRPVDLAQAPHIGIPCLPDTRNDFTGKRCWTTGWGKDAFGDFGKYQNILKEVDVPVISHGQCQAQLRQTRLGYTYNLNPGMLCAGGEEGKDAWGGPLVCEQNNVWYLAGIVSWGIGCGHANVPGVYVRVSSYRQWINQILQH